MKRSRKGKIREGTKKSLKGKTVEQCRKGKGVKWMKNGREGDSKNGQEKKRAENASLTVQ